MKRLEPPINLTDSRFRYVDSANTDIRERFRTVIAKQKLERMRQETHHDIFAARRENANVGTD